MKRPYPLQGLLKSTAFAWRYRITAAGKLLLLVLWISGMTGSAMLTIPIHHLFWAFACTAFLASLAGLIMRPRVRFTGDLPQKITAGETARGSIELRNLSRLPACEVGLGLFGLPRGLTYAGPEMALPVLPSGASATLPVVFRAERRGLYPMPDLEAYTTFAFHFYRRRGTARRTPPLLVLPAFHPLIRVDIPLGRRYQPGGVALTSNIGESPEYIGNREYRPGDPARRIDFRSWARIARPVVREYQEEYFCRVALVLDTFVGRRRARPRMGHPDLEAAVSLCAAVADALTRGEVLIDIFAAGPQLYVFRAGRNLLHFDNVLEILACVDECRANPFETLAPALADELQNISSVVYVLLDWDDAREAFVRAAVESQCRTKVVLVREGPTTKPFADAASWAGPLTVLTPDSVRRGEVDLL